MENERIVKWMIENRRKIGTSIAVILVMCVGLGLYSVYSANDADKPASIKQQSVSKSDKVGETVSGKIKTTKKTEDTSKNQGDDTKAKNNRKTEAQEKENIEIESEVQGNQVEAKGDSAEVSNLETDENTPVASDSGGAEETINKPVTNSGTGAASTNGNGSIVEENEQEEAHQPIWIVDQAAWTETISEPIYEFREYSLCNTCGEDITGNETAHLKAHVMNGENGSWRSAFENVQIGTNTYEVFHEEVGHWE